MFFLFEIPLGLIVVLILALLGIDFQGPVSAILFILIIYHFVKIFTSEDGASRVWNIIMVATNIGLIYVLSLLPKNLFGILEALF